MKLSARNVISGTIVDIRSDNIAAQVQIDIGGGKTITSTITADSAQRLGLQVGKAVNAVVKASDVIIGVDD